MGFFWFFLNAKLIIEKLKFQMLKKLKTKIEKKSEIFALSLLVRIKFTIHFSAASVSKFNFLANSSKPNNTKSFTFEFNTFWIILL